MYELSLVVVSSGYSLVMVLGLLVAVASLVRSDTEFWEKTHGWLKF